MSRPDHVDRAARGYRKRSSFRHSTSYDDLADDVRLGPPAPGGSAKRKHGQGLQHPRVSDALQTPHLAIEVSSAAASRSPRWQHPSASAGGSSRRIVEGERAPRGLVNEVRSGLPLDMQTWRASLQPGSAGSPIRSDGGPPGSSPGSRRRSRARSRSPTSPHLKSPPETDDDRRVLIKLGLPLAIESRDNFRGAPPSAELRPPRYSAAHYRSAERRLRAERDVYAQYDQQLQEGALQYQGQPVDIAVPEARAAAGSPRSAKRASQTTGPPELGGRSIDGRLPARQSMPLIAGLQDPTNMAEAAASASFSQAAFGSLSEGARFKLAGGTAAQRHGVYNAIKGSVVPADKFAPEEGDEKREPANAKGDYGGLLRHSGTMRKHDDGEDEEAGGKSNAKKRSCRNAAWAFSVVCAVVGIGVTLYCVWPHKPELLYLGVIQTAGGQPFTVHGGETDNPIELAADWTLQLRYSSNGPMDWTLAAMNAQVLAVISSGEKKIASGTATSVNIYAGEKSGIVRVPLRLSYSAPSGADTVAAALKSSCDKPSSSSSSETPIAQPPIAARITLDSQFGGAGWIMSLLAGLKIGSFQNEFTAQIKCPRNETVV